MRGAEVATDYQHALVRTTRGISAAIASWHLFVYLHRTPHHNIRARRFHWYIHIRFAQNPCRGARYVAGGRATDLAIKANNDVFMVCFVDLSRLSKHIGETDVMCVVRKSQVRYNFFLLAECACCLAVK